MAEQHATRGFKDTVIFEPFAGAFGITRVAAEEFGWTCSQPMDLLDGYDLLSGAGRQLVKQVLAEHRPYLVVLAFDCRIWSSLTNLSPEQAWDQLRRGVGRRALQLVRWICQEQDRAGRYYLVENPCGSVAWFFEGILGKLLENARGKFLYGDQCRFGKKDSESKRPVRKRTGWLSNSEPILNQWASSVSARLAHEQVLGSNTGGLRSKQAAEYPRALCRAVCQGALETMVLDYAADMTYHQGISFEGAYEGGEDAHDFDSGDEDQEEPAEDEWRLEDGDRLLRLHRVPRRRLFLPLSSTAPPCPLASLQSRRRTMMVLQDGARREHVDNWHEASWNPRGIAMDHLWTDCRRPSRLWRRKSNSSASNNHHQINMGTSTGQRHLLILPPTRMTT